jgi:hypothetical protein
MDGEDGVKKGKDPANEGKRFWLPSQRASHMKYNAIFKHYMPHPTATLWFDFKNDSRQM